ncbi:hypothetical protein WA158_005377 [Blastocystis sp. Blastoise]
MNAKEKEKIDKFYAIIDGINSENQVVPEIKPYQSKRKTKDAKNGVSSDEDSDSDVEIPISLPLTSTEENETVENMETSHIQQCVEIEEKNNTNSTNNEVKNTDVDEELKKEIVLSIREKLKKKNKDKLQKYKPVLPEKHFVDPLSKLDVDEQKRIQKEAPKVTFSRIGYGVTKEQAQKAQEYTQRKMMQRMCGRDWRQNNQRRRYMPEKPPIIKEYKRGGFFGNPRFFKWIKSGAVITAIGLSWYMIFYMPYPMVNGQDHCFTGIRKKYFLFRDQFFGVNNNESKKE